jgi:ferritin-like metal-binding protein YciE
MASMMFSKMDSLGRATSLAVSASEAQQRNCFLEETYARRIEKAYIEELKDIYNAENQLIKALPKMAKSASSEELRKGFEEHLGENPKGKKCKGMEGLMEEGSEVMQNISREL